jgi:hypothetical protein
LGYHFTVRPPASGAGRGGQRELVLLLLPDGDSPDYLLLRGDHSVTALARDRRRLLAVVGPGLRNQQYDGGHFRHVAVVRLGFFSSRSTGRVRRLLEPRSGDELFSLDERDRLASVGRTFSVGTINLGLSHDQRHLTRLRLMMDKIDPATWRPPPVSPPEPGRPSRPAGKARTGAGPASRPPLRAAGLSGSPD